MTNELIKRAKKGDKTAFSEIILYYHNDLYKIARTRLSQSADIEDAVQETIITAYEAIHKLKNPSKFKPWLVTILINQCNRIYNEQTKARNVASEYELNENYTKNSQDSINLEFNALMDLLNPDERTILVLYYSEGYKTKEIAKILDMNESTVRNKMSKARRKIEINLKEEYSNE